MNTTYINPFLEALIKVLEQFGITGVEIGNMEKKERTQVTLDVTAIVGLVGDIKGNVAYSFSQETAKKLISAMAPGMPVDEFNMMVLSAIGELSNMTTGKASILLSDIGVNIDISPPSIIVAEEIYFIISPVQSIAININTPAGRIEVNIEIE
ncbi:MAG TPA: chemotaxis protein CheX [Firmicutes bacterium]|jgi:chemotaxis protein CheX|nr:chemotaxis protein CheX [Bacillota bacterium]